jgi:hypothetical protein
MVPNASEIRLAARSSLVAKLTRAFKEIQSSQRRKDLDPPRGGDPYEAEPNSIP